MDPPNLNARPFTRAFPYVSILQEKAEVVLGKKNQELMLRSMQNKLCIYDSLEEKSTTNIAVGYVGHGMATP